MKALKAIVDDVMRIHVLLHLKPVFKQLRYRLIMSRRGFPKLHKLFILNPRERALAWLRAHSWPRLLMSAMLMLTIGGSFLSGVQMHDWGFAPLLRYPLAVVIGWVVFLLLVGAWVLWQRWRHAPAERTRANSRARSNNRSKSGGSPSIDLPIPSGSRSISSLGGGGGGEFGGAGASESFAATSQDTLASESPSIFSGESSSGSSASSGGGFDIDVGDAAGFLLLLAAVTVALLAVFGAVIYAVYNAPIFFAELLIDGGVGTWLYRRADIASRPDWIRTAIKRSAWPVVILITLFIALAWAMHYVAPGAMTLSEAFDVLQKS
jgi:hypothetical protein